MILGIVLIVSGIRKSFKLTIYASECSPSPINIGEGALSLQGNAVFTLLSASRQVILTV